VPSAKSKAKKPSKTTLQRTRKQLERQRQEILDLYQHDLAEGQRAHDEGGADDLVDRANNAYNREFMLALSGSERDLLRDIDAALERVDAATYGECQHCATRIPAARLKAVPWARYCVVCQEQVEQGIFLETD